MRRPKPNFGVQRSASGSFSVARSLPTLKMPLSAARQSVPRPKPQIGKPAPGGRVKGGRNG